MSKIAIIGGGYVGLHTAIRILDKNKNLNKIEIIDSDLNKINLFKQRKNPIPDTFVNNFLNKNTELFEKINYVHSSEFNPKKYNYFFISLSTNPDKKRKNYSLNTNLIFKYVSEIKNKIPDAKIIIRSTINFNDFEKLKKMNLSYWPEFLSQGQSVEKNINSHKIIFGKAKNIKNEEIMNLLEDDSKNIQFLSIEESILLKIFHNSFDAFAITISNLLANIAQSNNLQFSKMQPILNDLLSVKPRVKKPGIGYGGSCYPKDSRVLFNMLSSKNDFKLIDELNKYNLKQQQIYKKFIPFIKESKKILILGISFKGDTNDLTETPTKPLINYLIRKKHNFKIWEPNIELKYLKEINKKIENKHIVKDINYNIKNSDLIFIASDWKIFHEFLNESKFKNKKIVDLKATLPKNNESFIFSVGDKI